MKHGQKTQTDRGHRIGKDRRLLRYQFTTEERNELGKKLADQQIALTALEDDKKRVNTDFAARITAAQAEITGLSNKVAAGYDHRMTECKVRFNWPKSGQKTVTRIDTGEQVAIEEMTASEMQEPLNLGELTDEKGRTIGEKKQTETATATA